MDQPLAIGEYSQFWSLYVRDEEEVVLFETRASAEAAKKRWETSTYVSGPFEHMRKEMPLIHSALSAARQLDAIRSTATLPSRVREELSGVSGALARSIAKVYPFDQIPVPGDVLTKLDTGIEDEFGEGKPIDENQG